MMSQIPDEEVIADFVKLADGADWYYGFCDDYTKFCKGQRQVQAVLLQASHIKRFYTHLASQVDAIIQGHRPSSY